jgi:hypothetical protein
MKGSKMGFKMYLTGITLIIELIDRYLLEIPDLILEYSFL